MYRILIACGDERYTDGLGELLHEGFAVETCNSGKWALELMRSFAPDVLVLDNRLTEYDCMSVIQMIRASGNLVHIILITNFINDSLEKRLEALDVGTVLLKPCSLQPILGHICRACEMIGDPACDWDVEQVLDNLLLQLSFAPGPKRYSLIRQAVLACYYSGCDTNHIQMKVVYIKLAKENKSSCLCAEKALRDAIDAAFGNGDKQLWGMLFAACAKRPKGKPSNEEFCARITMFLRQRSRVKPAYKELPAKIM